MGPGKPCVLCVLHEGFRFSWHAFLPRRYRVVVWLFCQMAAGLIDIGNHMSFLRLSDGSGRFVVVDAVDPLGPGEFGAKGGAELKVKRHLGGKPRL